MAGKARVHELAKELGVTSKEVLARLNEQGEFVKSASSTVEAPVARRLRESFGGGKPRDAAEAPRRPPATASAKARQGVARRGQSLDTALDQAIGKAAGNGEATAKPADAGAVTATSVAPAAARAAPAPAPGRPSAPPRDRTAARTTGAPARHDAGPASRSDAEARRPHPARRQQPVLVGATRRPADPASAGAPPRRAQARSAAPGRVARQHAAASGRRRRARPRPPRPGAPASRRRPARWPRRQPATAAAAVTTAAAAGAASAPRPAAGGVPAAVRRWRWRWRRRRWPSRAARRCGRRLRPSRRCAPARPQVQAGRSARNTRSMQAPVVGGVRLPHGNGETIRLARGASLIGLRREDRRQPGRAGAGAVQPRRNGDGHPVGRRRDARAARRRDELQRPGRQPGGRGPRAAGILRPHLRRRRRHRGGSADPSAGGDRDGPRRPR